MPTLRRSASSAHRTFGLGEGTQRFVRLNVIAALSLVFAITGATAEDLEHCYNGVRAQEVGNHDLAVDQYTRCIDAEELTVGNLALAYNNRGLAFRYKRDYDQAIRDYDEALRLKPDYAIAYNNRGSRGVSVGSARVLRLPPLCEASIIRSRAWGLCQKQYPVGPG